MTCDRCNKKTNTRTNGLCDECFSIYLFTIKNKCKGWVCPKCNNVYSPETKQCLFCNGITQ